MDDYRERVFPIIDPIIGATLTCFIHHVAALCLSFIAANYYLVEPCLRQSGYCKPLQILLQHLSQCRQLWIKHQYSSFFVGELPFILFKPSWPFLQEEYLFWVEWDSSHQTAHAPTAHMSTSATSVSGIQTLPASTTRLSNFKMEARHFPKTQCGTMTHSWDVLHRHLWFINT